MEEDYCKCSVVESCGGRSECSSKGYKVSVFKFLPGKDLLVQVPKDKQLVCDYWAVNTYSAYLDMPVYCIDVQKEMNMILFDNDLREKLSDGSRYTLGLQKLQQTAPFTDLFMLSTHPPGTLAQIDSVLNRQYEIILVDKRDGAIEKFSNLYLYQIRVR